MRSYPGHLAFFWGIGRRAFETGRLHRRENKQSLERKGSREDTHLLPKEQLSCVGRQIPELRRARTRYYRKRREQKKRVIRVSQGEVAKGFANTSFNCCRAKKKPCDSPDDPGGRGQGWGGGGGERVGGLVGWVCGFVGRGTPSNHSTKSCAGEKGKNITKRE